MKLLLCIKCTDIRSLRVDESVSCRCGKSSGKYLKDVDVINGVDAVYSGDNAMLIGFSNHSFVDAVRDQKACGDRGDLRGREFNAFIIPEKARSVRKVIDTN